MPPSGRRRARSPRTSADCYDALADAGLTYGPAFQGLRAAWQLGEDLYAEVGLPEGADGDAFGLHPALLDAALHAAALGGAEAGGVPFSWTGVSLHASGASHLRVQIRDAGGAMSVALADSTGEPVASVESLVVRPLSAGQLQAADRDALFTVDWVPVPLTDARVDLGTGPEGEPLPTFADLDVPDGGGRPRGRPGRAARGRRRHGGVRPRRDVLGAGHGAVVAGRRPVRPPRAWCS